MMTQKVLLGKYIFKLLFLQYGQEPYLELNQKSMVELFCKNSDQLLVFNFFRKKAPPQMLNCVPKRPLLPVRKKEAIFYIIQLHIILYNFVNNPAYRY